MELKLPAFWAMYPGAVDAFVSQFAEVYHTLVAMELDAARMTSRAPAKPYSVAGKHTAVIQLQGPIFKRAGNWARYGFAGNAEVEEAANEAYSDKAIRNVVVLADTPGGDVDGLYEAGEAISRLNSAKPVVFQVRGMLASAGYYLAANASRIYTGPMDLTGSIGVRMALADYSRMFENAGIKVIPIDTGEHKSAGLVGTEITEAQQAEFQRIVDGYMDNFVNTIRKGRGDRISRESLDSVADGRVFFPKDAQQSGLIDGVQGITETLAEINSSSSRTLTNAERNRRRLALLD